MHVECVAVAMAGRATGPRGADTSKKKSKLAQVPKKGHKSSRSTVSRISGLFYRQVLVMGGGDTPSGCVIGKVYIERERGGRVRERVRERETETETEKQRQTDRQTDRQR